MITITVTKTEGFFERLEESLTEAFRKGLRDLTIGAHREWAKAAQQNLRTSRETYLNSLQEPQQIDKDTFEITLQNKTDASKNFLATAIEVGTAEYDLKPGLLGGPGAQNWSQFKGGGRKLGAPFLDVPFKTGDAITQQDPDYWRRVSPRSKGWIHPGFKPGGPRHGGKPFRDVAKEYIKEESKNVFGPLIAKITV